MKKWLMSQSIVVKVALAVACVAIVAAVGLGVALNTGSNKNTTGEVNQVVDITDEAAPTTATPVVTETDTKQEPVATTDPVDETTAEPEVTTPVVAEEPVVTEPEVTEPEVTEPAKVKTGHNLVNGNFKDGLFAFEFYALNQADYSTDKGFAVDITDTGSEDWHVQLKQGSIRLENGKWYKLTLDAKSTLNRTINVSMMHDGMSDNNWTSYANAKTLKLTNSWKTYTVVFQMTEKTDNESVFALAMGTVAGNHITKAHTVSVNNIKLEKLPDNFIDSLKNGDNLIANADFAYEDLLWEGSVVAPGAANVSFENNKAKFEITNPGSVDWHVQLKQSGIVLDDYQGYRLTFDVTSTVERIIKVGIMDTNYIKWYGGGDIYVAPGTKTVSVEFNNTLGSNSNALLMISLGLIEGSTTPAGTVELSNFRLVKANVSSAANNGGSAASNPTTGLGNNWEVYDHESAHTSGSYVDGEGAFVINITNTGSEAWHVQLTNKTMSLEKGKTYKIGFDGKSTTDRVITYMIQMNGGSWTPYSSNDIVTLTSDWTHFEQTFTMNSASDSAAVYNFSLGKVNDDASYDAHTVTLKNITFEEVVTNSPEKTETGYIIKATNDVTTDEYGSKWIVAIDPADYGVDAVGKTLTVSATLKSEGAFSGILGACRTDNWAWVDNGTANYEAGEHTWTLTVSEFKGALQFQINSMEADSVEIADLTFTVSENAAAPEETEPEDTVKPLFVINNNGENKGELWLNIPDYGITETEGKKVKVTATLKSSAFFCGTVSGNDASGWNQTAEQKADSNNKAIWSNTFAGIKDVKIDIWYMGAATVEVLDVKMEYVDDEGSTEPETPAEEEKPATESGIVVKATDEYETDGSGNHIWKVKVDHSTYGITQGKTVAVSATFKSDADFAVMIGACSGENWDWKSSAWNSCSAGSNEINFEIPEFMGGLELQIFNINGESVVITDIKLTEKAETPAEEEKPAEEEQPAKNLIEVSQEIEFDNSLPGELWHKSVKISVTLASDDEFNGAIGVNDSGDWNWESKNGAAGTVTWTRIVKSYDGGGKFTVWYRKGTYVELLGIKLEAYETAETTEEAEATETTPEDADNE